MDRTVATRDVFCAGVATGVLGAYVLYKALTLTGAQRGTLLGALIGNKGHPSKIISLDREIEFHFEDAEVYFRHGRPPEATGRFAARCALLCEKYTVALQDFTGDRDEATCLDIGCSIGATTIELSKSFPLVMGIDSPERLSVAETLLKERRVTYTAIVEGSVTEKREAVIDTNLELDGMRYLAADLGALPENLSPVDCILAAMTLERLQCPKRFLTLLPRLLKSDGTVVLVSSYNWDPAHTPQSHQLGGFSTAEGKHVSSEAEVKRCMDQTGFELKHEENIPFMKKLNDRKYEWVVAPATVWRRKESEAAGT